MEKAEMYDDEGTEPNENCHKFVEKRRNKRKGKGKDINKKRCPREACQFSIEEERKERGERESREGKGCFC